ncbi:hypothetical protein TNCV_905111 [Trichonephila clavipes]|nr:hypothetical protein TNCV_905111 [Trichonephila clavipes]
MIKQVKGCDTLSRTQAFKWHRRFREGRESVKDDKIFVYPQTFRNAENIGEVSAADLNMHTMCQHVVPRMLNEDQSADEVKRASQADLKDMAKNVSQKLLR